MAAYDIIELFCELIVVRLPIIESQRQCPIDLREAISSLIFAAPRCADIPELLDIRSLFGAKYGKEFVAAAAELRPDCGVNRTGLRQEKEVCKGKGRLALLCIGRELDLPWSCLILQMTSANAMYQIIEKLSVRAPSGEVKLKLMKEIAKEHHVEWDPAESEAELLKLPEDLLEGPNKFVGSTQMRVGSDKDNFHSVPGQKNELCSDSHQNTSRVPSGSTTLSRGASSSRASTFGISAASSVENIYHECENNTSSGQPPLGKTNLQPTNSHQDNFRNRTLPSAKSKSFTARNVRGATCDLFEQSDSHKVNARNRNIMGISSKSNENRSGSSGDCDLYFKDTASAAQAAADSAEKAIVAARAAAQFAKQNQILKDSQQTRKSSFDSSLSDETSDLNYSRMNRRPSLNETQSFDGYDHSGRTWVESHPMNEKFYRNASGQISRQSATPCLDNEYEFPTKRTDRQDASWQHGNRGDYVISNASVMQKYHNIPREEKHCFGGARGGFIGQDSDVEDSSPPKRRAMVYSNTLSSLTSDDSDGIDSESEEEIEYRDSSRSQVSGPPWRVDSSSGVMSDFTCPQNTRTSAEQKSTFDTEAQNKLQSNQAIQPPSRLPPGVPLSSLSNSQSLPSMGESKTSRENSFKGNQLPSSHVHPKLPDYDALAARFEALKSNRQ
eukprot:Gb_14681 [translate_table: standard]